MEAPYPLPTVARSQRGRNPSIFGGKGGVDGRGQRSLVGERVRRERVGVQEGKGWAI